VAPRFHPAGEGDLDALVKLQSAFHAGEGIPPTGRQVTYAGVAIFRLVEGGIVEGWVLGDMCGLLRQLGATRWGGGQTG
jgi:hypothetical protein